MMQFTDVFTARFWSRVVKSDDCWEWAGAHDNHGYSKTSFEYRDMAAHRVAYELVVGPIPEGLTIDHLCRNRGCVNPAHLEPVTQRENTLRGVSPAALPCSGDPLSEWSCLR